MSQAAFSIVLRYGVALLSITLTVVSRLLLQPFLENDAPLLLFTLSVMISAWYGGYGPGVFATLLGAVAGAYLFLEPIYSIRIADTSDRVAVALFVVTGLLISILSQALRSSRQRAEESAQSLRQSEENHRRIVETASEGIWMIDAEARTSFVNRRMTEMLDCSREEMLGESLFKFIFDEDRAEAERKFDDNKRGDNRQFDFRLRRKDGSAVWARISTNTILDGSGELLGVLGMFTDITERREREEERARLLISEREARRTAETANRTKDEFLATVSHDLRTPLASMLMWIRMLDSGNLDEATATHARQTLISNIKSLSQLIDDLLDVSRIISGKLRINPRPVDLVHVIEAAINVVRPAAEAKNIKIRTNLNASERRVAGDPDRLQQVLWNLLSNAIKFTPAEGSVEIKLGCVDSQARIAVIDAGIGIAEENLPHVFERFYQVGKVGEHRGLGLGLAIVRHLVEMHGGIVRAESAGEGMGAIFKIELPLMPIQLPDENLASEVSAIRHLQSAILEGVRVLVVDDEKDSREVIATMLKYCGACVTEAASSAEAFEVLTNKTQEQPPDLFVCDIMMPGEDGYALIRKVRALASEPAGKIPAVALTARARKEDRERCLTAGFQAHLSKPVEPSELVAVVAGLAERTGENPPPEKGSSPEKSSAAAS